MDERLHILITRDEKERYRAIAEREGQTLSGWIRAAIRERAERYAASHHIRTAGDLDRFFHELDEHESTCEEMEPDWEVHARLIDEGRRGGAPGPP